MRSILKPRRSGAELKVIVAIALVAGVCPPTLASAQEGMPSISTNVAGRADSVLRQFADFLRSKGDTVLSVDQSRKVIRAAIPQAGEPVVFQFTARGDSTTISARGSRGSMIAGMAGADAILKWTNARDAATDAGVTHVPGELPRSQWQPELFITPQGRFWMARSGLFTADSLPNRWRRALGTPGDSIDPDDLRIGVHMAFVDANTALLGFPDRSGDSGSSVYRTTDAGHTWSPVPADGLAWVDDMAAAGQSVWVFGTQWVNDQRRGLFLRSRDGGVSWERHALPPPLNDVTVLHRASPSRAYVATVGSNPGPVFWVTTDSGNTWQPIPTPHDKGLLDIPDYGDRVEQIATVGEWLVVREYGTMFVTRADSIQWRRRPDLDQIATDSAHDQLFAMTESRYAELLDHDLKVVWRTRERVPAGDVEKALFHAGVGYISMSFGEIYEARDGVLQLAQPSRH